MKPIRCLLIKNNRGHEIFVEPEFDAMEAVLGASIEGCEVRYVNGKPLDFAYTSTVFNGPRMIRSVISAQSGEVNLLGDPIEVFRGPLLIFKPPLPKGDGRLRPLSTRDVSDLLDFLDVGGSIIYRFRPVPHPGRPRKEGRKVTPNLRPSEKGGRHGKQ